MKKWMLLLLLLLCFLPFAAQAGDCASGQHHFQVIFSQPADCISVGYDQLQCKDCGAIEMRQTTGTAPHSFVTVDYTAPDCVHSGYKREQCSVCFTIREIYPSATNQHTWSNTSVVTQPTCVSDGMNSGVCSICGVAGTYSTPKTGKHEFGEWITLKEATETTHGQRIHYCVHCNFSVTDRLFLPGTLYVGVYDLENVKHVQRMLSDCNYYFGAAHGTYDKATEAAIQAFQADAGLTADGIAWTATRAALTDYWRKVTGQEPPTPAPTAEPTPEPTATPEPTPEFPASCQTEDGQLRQCEKHNAMTNMVAMLLDSASSPESLILVQQQCRTLWQTEMEVLYQQAMAQADDVQALKDEQANFATYLSMREKVWRTTFHNDDAQLAANVNLLLAQQCAKLCQDLHGME